METPLPQCAKLCTELPNSDYNEVPNRRHGARAKMLRCANQWHVNCRFDDLDPDSAFGVQLQQACLQEEFAMMKSLHINPDKCTGCLQCEMACSFEHFGMFNNVQVRHQGLRLPPRRAQGSLHLHAVRGSVVPAFLSGGSDQDRRGHRCQDCPRGRLRRLQGMHHRLSVRHCELRTTTPARYMKCDLCGGDPACAQACPTGAITYIDSDWTGLERMRLWATRTDITPQANEPRSNLPRANQGPHA